MTASVRSFPNHLSKLCLCAALFLIVLGRSSCQTSVSIDAVVPADHNVIGEDQYVCFRVDLPKESLKIVGVDPLSTQDVVHHMLLFGCASEGPPNEAWPCHMTSPCRGGFERVLYGWGKNAPAMALPKGVGYSVGPGSAIQSLVLQVHYLQARPRGDQSGITLQLTRNPTPFSAGMINYASYFTIPPGKPEHPIENQCCYSGFELLKGFAFRVHTHALGRSVNLERIQQQEGNLTSQELCRNDPQLPQGFTPLEEHIVIRPGDTLKTTCMFDSSSQTQPVNAGATHHDEMCNLYLMLYSQLPYFMSCYGSPQVEKHGTGGIPTESRLELDLHPTWQPPPSRDAQLPLKAKNPRTKFGQVSAVSRGHNDDVWVFHRGQVVWDLKTFDPREDGVHVANPKAFVKAPAVVQLNQDTGEVLSSWGSNRFLMPHGLTVDLDGNIWVTDCGLHQAIKFDPKGNELLALGTRLEPGSDTTHLCKPTHVAVASDGTIYVADGYCNSRVVRYNAKGAFEAEYRLPRGEMAIPHSLVLDECNDSLYVADRENSEVHRFSISSQTLQATWNLKLSGFVYAVAAGPYGTVLALCWSHRHDPRKEAVNVVLLTADSTGGGAEETWRLEGVGAPHDIAVTASPMPVRGTGDRALALFVAETKPSDSWLRKYLFVPPGTSMMDMVDAGIKEEGRPDSQALSQSHGVEARLALAERVRQGFGSTIGNVLTHKFRFSPDDGADAAAAHNHALVDEAQPLIEPAGLDPAGSQVLHNHPVEAVPDAATRASHANDIGQPGQVQQHDLPIVGGSSGVNEGVVLPNTPNLADASSAGQAANSAASHGAKSLYAAHDGVFGHHNAAQSQDVSYGGALTQLFSFGMPVALFFAAAAFILWRRLGEARPSVSVSKV